MPARKSSSTLTCPSCFGMGKSPRTGQPCQTCGGAGAMPSEMPFPYHYPFNLTVTQAVSGTQPTQTVPGSPGNPFTQGTNPVLLKLGNEGAFKWIFNLINCTSPTVIGDASAWLQLALFDLSGTNWPFQAAPIFANLFAGSAQLPFPQLEPLTFGQNTQLSLQGYPVNFTGNIIVIGVGDTTATTFNGLLNGPVLPGSVTVTDPAGVIVGADDGNGGISGTGITGTVNYTTGAIAVTYVAAPGAGNKVTVTYTQGCAVINAQFDLWGFYLRPLSQADLQQMQSPQS